MILQFPVHLGIATWLFLLSYGAGKILLRVLRWKPEDPQEAAVASLLVGFIFVSYLIWFAGIFGWCRPWHLRMLFSIFTLSVILIPLGNSFIRFFFLKDQRPKEDSSEARGRTGERGQKGFFWKTAFLITAIIAVEQILSAHSPAIWRDDLSYHLYLPKAYLEMGRIEPPPFAQRQSFYHQIFNMIYLPAMAWGGSISLAIGTELAAKMINAIWQFIFVFITWLLGRRAGFALEAKQVAALSLFASPGLLFLSQTAMTDLPAACFALGGLLLYLNFEQSQRLRHLWLSALLSAFALNKYTAWSYFCAVFLIFFLRHLGRPRALLTGTFAFGSCAALCLFPLAFYLWSHTGNPLYPIPLFGLPADSIEASMQKFLQEGKEPLNLLRHTWHHLFAGEQPDSAPLIVLAPAALLVPAVFKGNAGLILAYSILAYALRFFLVGPSALLYRYILPSYACWMLIAGAAWHYGASHGALARRLLKTFLLAGLIVPCLLKSTLRFPGHLHFNLGLSSWDEYMRRFYPSEGWETVQAVNRLPPESRVAVLDHHFMPYHYKNLGAGLWPIPAEVMALDNPEDIKKALLAAGATHVLFIPSRWNHFKTPQGGLLLFAIYFGPHLPCRWWSQGTPLPFLKPIFSHPRAILFGIYPS